MTYATVEELAAALHVRVTAENEAGLTACLVAAAAEIDHDCDWFEPDVPAGKERYPEGDGRNALLNRVNLLRGVEWWKANDATFGVLGYDTTAMRIPRDAFARHAVTLSACKQKWGVA